MFVFSWPKRRTWLQVAAVAAIIMLGGRLFIRYNDQANAAEAFAKAQDYRAKHDLLAARIELMNAVRDNPQLVDAYVAQAEVALEMFDGAMARDALEKAMSRGIDPLQVQHLLGEAYYYEGDLERAEGLLSTDEIPKKYKAYADRILGRVLLDSGHIDEARDSFDAALKLGRENSLLWTDIARFRLALGDDGGAIDAADYAVKLDGLNVRAIELRGRLMRSQFGMAAALPWFERGLAINPNDIPLLEEYGVTLGELGHASEMLEIARKIVSLDIKNGRAYYMQAVIAARAREFALAQRILALAGSQINETPGAMLVSGIVEYQLGNVNKAADIFERLVNLQPNNLEARKLMARAKQSAGENFDALDAIRPLVDRGQADSYSAMIAARAFEATGDRDKAAGGLSEASMAKVRSAMDVPQTLSLRMAEDGALKNPRNAAFVIPYIRALMKDGNPESALVFAKQLQADNPGVPDAHMLVGDVQAERGEYSAAIEAYLAVRKISFSEGVMLRLVDAYRRLGQPANANIVLADFARFNPNSQYAQRLFAYLMLDEARWADAIPLLEKLRDRVGFNDSILNANIARAYSGVGRHDDAVLNAAMAYKIDPANAMVTLVYAQTLLKSGKRPKAALELFAKADILMPGNKDVALGLVAAKAAYAKSRKVE